MYTARIVVLTTAPGAGGIAAYLARGFDARSLPTEPVVQLQTPAATASNHLIRRNRRPEATDQSAKPGESVNVVRYGVQRSMTIQK
jgi:pilus assembly protein CpaB